MIHVIEIGAIEGDDIILVVGKVRPPREEGRKDRKACVKGITTNVNDLGVWKCSVDQPDISVVQRHLVRESF